MVIDNFKSQLKPRFDIKDPSLVLYLPFWRTDMVARGGYIASGTGTMAVTPLVLDVGANTITALTAGTFTIYSPTGGSCASGTATITGSPVTMTAGIPTTVTTGVTTGNFTVTTNNIIRSQDKTGHLCTVANALWSRYGRILDGTGDTITIPDHASLSALTAFHIIMWFKSSSVSATQQTIIAKHATSNREWILYCKPSTGQVVCAVYDESATAYLGRVRATGGGFWDGVWHFLEFVWNGTVPAIYKDVTTQIDNTNDNSGTFVAIENLAADVLIGSGTSVGIGDLDATVGEVIIFNRVLSTSERTRLMQATKWRYK